MFQAIKSFFRVTMLWIVLLPYVVWVIGAGSNQLVLIANHDKFPVMLNERARAHFEPDANGLIDNRGHCVMTKDTHLNFLADIFDMGGWYSIGDFLLDLAEWLQGFCIFVWMALVVKSLYRKATV